MPPEQFARFLSRGEIALGAALLVPFVPSALVGAALVGFSAGLVRLYLKTPGMTQPHSIRPTQEGIGLAKDVWLLGAGLTLLLDSLPQAKALTATERSTHVDMGSALAIRFCTADDLASNWCNFSDTEEQEAE